jgi:hypothetical protein
VLTDANEEIIRLDISVQEPARVYVLNSLEKLDGNHEHSLQTEFPSAVFEQVF